MSHREDVGCGCRENVHVVWTADIRDKRLVPGINAPNISIDVTTVNNTDSNI